MENKDKKKAAKATIRLYSTEKRETLPEPYILQRINEETGIPINESRPVIDYLIDKEVLVKSNPILTPSGVMEEQLKINIVIKGTYKEKEAYIEKIINEIYKDKVS